jgi:hypothetical protein
MISGIDNVQSFRRYYILKILERYTEEFVLTGSACYLPHPADLDFFAEYHDHTEEFLSDNGFVCVSLVAEGMTEDAADYTEDGHVMQVFAHHSGIHVMLVDDFQLRKEKINPTVNELLAALHYQEQRLHIKLLTKPLKRVIWYVTMVQFHEKDTEEREDKKVPYSGLPRGTTITHVPDGTHGLEDVKDVRPYQGLSQATHIPDGPFDENDTPAERGD